MAEKPEQQSVSRQERPSLWQRDRPGCIKYVLLVFVLLLVAAEIGTGEFRGFPNVGGLTWVVILVKLLLIALLVALIRVQRSLRCELTEPGGCTEETPDPTEGILYVTVRGTAAGGAFSHYTLEVRKAGEAAAIPGLVSYPGGAGSGGTPVVNGDLGRIDTTSLADGSYEVLLTVHPAWGGSPKPCTTTFQLLKAIVYINRIAGVPAISHAPVADNSNPFDPAAELEASGDRVAVGGSMRITGSAYIYECAARKIKTYAIRHAKVAAPGPEPGQPAKGDPVPGAFGSLVTQLDYVSPDHYEPWTRVGPAATDLVNTWKTMTIGANTYFKLNPGAWNSVPAGSGRSSLLLTAEDTSGVRYHDIQHVWLDNHPIQVKLVAFQWKNPATGNWETIPECTDLSLATHGLIRILGLAWDPLIDEDWWTPPAAPSQPNDNFGHYRLDYWKQFGPTEQLLGATPNRVPDLPAAPPVAVPTDADAGVLAEWDLETLDAGPSPSPGSAAPNSKLYRGEECTFTLRLFATDTTVVPGGPHHQGWDFESVKVVNDL